ncbi:MAG: DUF3604 domain-containing protein [Planctomycetota bacterium]
MQKPPPFHQRVLHNDAPGGEPARIQATIPSITSPGQPFELKIAVLDEMGYPSIKCDAGITVSIPGQSDLHIEDAFKPGEPAVGGINDLQMQKSGCFRLQLQVGNLNAYSNPTLCTDDDIADIYWGDPHVHTNLSDCHPEKCRSLNFAFTCARFVTGLDWMGAADHVSGGRCDFSKWEEQKAVAEHHNAEDTFVTLPAYEASFPSGSGGDNNVYMDRFPETYVDHCGEGTIKSLCEELEDTMDEGDFFVVPHHTTRANKHGEISDDIYPGPRRMPLLEIHSKWGTSEYRGNPNALHNVHPGPSFAQDFLNRDMILGFIAGTDTHATMPSGGGYEPGHIDRKPGLTAVQSHALTREKIFSNMKNRHCYATSGERILLHGTIRGADFGQVVPPEDATSTPDIDVLIAARSNISRIDLIRDGERIHSNHPDDWKSRFSYTDNHDAPAYYYIRVTCSSGAQAWSSPVWIK